MDSEETRTDGRAVSVGSAEAAGSLDTVAKVVSIVSGLLSIGASLDSIFGGATGIDVQELTRLIVDEVRVVFERELAIDKIHDAVATEKSAVQFLNHDYANAVKAGEDDAQLYAALSTGRGGGFLNDLQSEINRMEEWSHTGQKDLAEQTISLYMLLSATALSWYQEMARRSTGKAHDSAVATIKSRAREYAKTGRELAEAVSSGRTAAIGGIQTKVDPYRGVVTQAWFDDSWGSGERRPVAATVPDLKGYGWRCPDPRGAINWLRPLCVGLIDGKGDPEAIWDQVKARECFAFGNDRQATHDWLRLAGAYGKWLVECSDSVRDLAELETKPLGDAQARPLARQ